MGLARRKSNSSKNVVATTNFDDAEGLIVNLGVIAALMMSFVVGLTNSVTTEEFARGDLAYLLRHNEDFRKYSLFIWEEMGKNSTFSIGPKSDVDVLDLHAILGSNARDGQHTWGGTGLWGREFRAAVAIMEADFPYPKMYAWKTFHEVRTIQNGGSDYINTFGVLANYCLCMALFGATFLYMALAYSPAKEDTEKGLTKSIQFWEKFGMPCSLLLYFFMGIGSIFFFLTLGGITNLRMPDIDQGYFATDIYIYLGSITWTMLMFFAIFLFVRLRAVSRTEHASTANEFSSVEVKKLGEELC